MIARQAPPVLTFENLSVPTGSDRTYAVHDMSVAVHAGETLCIVGESGSGKSVTALAAMALLPRAFGRPTGRICALPALYAIASPSCAMAGSSSKTNHTGSLPAQKRVHPRIARRGPWPRLASPGQSITGPFPKTLEL